MTTRTDLDRTFRFIIRHLAAAPDEADKIADARLAVSGRAAKLHATPTLPSAVSSGTCPRGRRQTRDGAAGTPDDGSQTSTYGV